MARTSTYEVGGSSLDTVTENAPVQYSSFALARSVFVSPARTFEDIARHPRFFLPFFSILLLVAGFWGAVYLKLGPSGVAVAVMQCFRRGTLVSQDEIDFALHFSDTLVRIVLMGSAIAVLSHFLIVAWVGARIANLFFDVKLRLRVALSATCYAYLAKTLAQTILGIPMVLFGDVDGLNFGNLLPTNIAFFLDPKDVSRTIYTLLQSLDLVQIAYFTLLGIGFSRDADDPASPVVMGASLGMLWMGWNVFSAAFWDFLLKP